MTDKDKCKTTGKDCNCPKDKKGGKCTGGKDVSSRDNPKPNTK